MADYMASNTWNLQPESNAETLAPSRIPKKVRFADLPQKALQAVQSPEPSRNIGSPGGILMGDSPASARSNIPVKRVSPAVRATAEASHRGPGEFFANSPSRIADDRIADDETEVSCLNRRVSIGHVVLNHEEEVGDSKTPDAKEPGSS
ncbi:hypothetical protein ACHAP5_011923 [Fusarium lateritium]